MASAQIPCTIRFYRITPTGSKVFLYGNDVRALGPSGSSDGAIASTPEKWIFLPVQNAPEKVLQVNDKLQVTAYLPTGATTDASDAEWVLPITLRNGSTEILGSPDDSGTWDAKVLGDIAIPTAVESVLCEKVVRQPFALGSNTAKAFVTLENNA